MSHVFSINHNQTMNNKHRKCLFLPQSHTKFRAINKKRFNLHFDSRFVFSFIMFSSSLLVTLYTSKNTVQALKYPPAHAVTLYMPVFKAIN